MIDAHMHMVLDGVDWKSAIGRHQNGADIPWMKRTLAHYKAQGFTWLRDGGDRWGVSAAAKALAADYGITYRTPLSPLYQSGHYGGIVGTSFDNLRQYHTAVVQLRSQGADFIKIMISGLMDLHRFGVLTEEGLPDAAIAEMIHIAHEEGLAVMAHANGVKNVLAAAAAGVDSVEHGAYLNGEALAAMEQAGTVWVPTLSTLAAPMGKGRFDDGILQAILDSALENIAAFHGYVAAGTEAGAWAVQHGTDLEYRLLLPLTDLDRGNMELMNKF